MAAEEGWGTSSGLPEELTGTVAEAWFGKQEGAEGDLADKRFIFWRLINIESDEYDGDEYTVRFGIGNGWEEVEGGERVVREDGKDKPFNNSTDYGRVINRVLGAAGGKEGKPYADAMKGAFDEVKSRGTQYEATVWEGLRFRFETQEFSSTINGEDVVWNRTLPVEYHGAQGGSESSGNGQVAEKEETATAPEPGDKQTEELSAQLAEIAKEADSHSDFVSKALSVDGVKDDGALLARVADESDNGFYAKANAA